MVEFDLSELAATDEGRFVVFSNDKVRWAWVYGGPGHPKSIEADNRRARKRIREDALKEQAVTNGKKWKAEERSVDEAKEDIIIVATERLLRWHLEDVVSGEPLNAEPKLNGAPLPFSEENARRFLREPKHVAILHKVLEWLGDENSFTQRSAKTSKDTPSGRSNSTATKKAAPAETD